MIHHWIFKPQPPSEIVKKLQKELNLSEIPATLLAQRGIFDFEQAKTFFRPSLSDLHNPFLMKDMEKAVQRVLRAFEKQEKILIYGDYDVDGTTAVSLMYLYLKQFTHKLAAYIPDRYTEGYGVSFQGVDYASENGFSLIIALDCGIKDIEKVQYASEKGIDFIICDHHRPSQVIPKAIAVLNPKQTDCNYPYKELCGCGVGFKLVQAINKTLKNPFEQIQPLLDLVAVAIGADIVPVTGENRVMLHYGLEILNKNPSVGLTVLLGMEGKPVQMMDIVFGLAPKINSAGRIEHGMFAVKLLTESSYSQAIAKAKQIETFNGERKELDATIEQEALNQIQANGEEEKSATVVYAPHWHKGVIGIVASRLIETYYRPTVVFTKSGEKYAASARSVQGFDIYEALEQCSEHIEQFGGHKYAAGLTILPEKYSLFKQKFEEVIAKTLPKELKSPKITIDTKLPLEKINQKMFNILKQFEPFGPQNMPPIFYAKNVIDTGFAKQIGKDNSHLRLTLKDFNGKNFFPAVGFNLGHKLELVKSGKPFEIVYSIEENHWNGNTSLQLKVRDIR
ncbi:single-stranded-DNA-specific exonuclease RecJ [Capnocytophaga felis]|uniref:Single-stranded-DNA-specific exonuclease RecJ n=1 Tax=Capnocytophaga felis TaxID=2267611 RepID=A0A5M4B7S4_9FLAO|nr:single-stranded-DNA-specific exonuclease RecJ [Capnocytophaga felis]GET45307.1 single-stranded-DNA-specific exonuclease RecJ [Capnocytophaga felis]GET47530.1 single-stranded-DNA-specific exonuclease RecJ [Capnocytophaga felis]